MLNKLTEKSVFCLAAAILIIYGAMLGYVYLIPVQVSINDAGKVYTVSSHPPASPHSRQ